MRLVDRYIFRQAGLASVGAFFALTGVIWITQALRQLDLVTTKGQTLLVFLALTLLDIPSIAIIIAPIALFIGVTFTLSRLNGDSELVVLSASGVSPFGLMRPFLVVSVATAILTGALSIWAIPSSESELTSLLMKVRADFLTRVVREGTFATLDQGFVFHYHQRARDGSLHGIFMEDRRDPQHVSTYMARSGETSASDSRNYLILEDGMIQRQSVGNPDPATVAFNRYAIDLAQFSPAADGAEKKPRERSTWSLLRAAASTPYERANAGAFRAELSNRLSAPLYAIALGLIGFASQQRSRTTRNARNAAVVVASVFMLVLRGAGLSANSLTQHHAGAVWLVYALPALGTLAALASVGGLFDSLSDRMSRARGARSVAREQEAT